MRKRNLILITLVFALIICATIQPAIAYFTTYVRAKGGHPVTMGDTTTIKEEFSGWTKKVTIHNDEKSEPVYIRAKVLYEGKYDIEVSGSGWTALQQDGYYYYGTSQTALTALNANGDTTQLFVEIKGIPAYSTDEKADNTAFNQLKDGESFSVVVVYESTPVRYNAAGTAYADWNAQIVEVGSTTGSIGGNS